MLATCFMLVFCLASESTLKMEATCSSESCVDYQQTTLCYVPEDRFFTTVFLFCKTTLCFYLMNELINKRSAYWGRLSQVASLLTYIRDVPLCLWVCSLFNYAFSIGTAEPDGRMIDEWRVWKNFEGGARFLFTSPYLLLLRGTEQINK
jgi:hypothetical protein